MPVRALDADRDRVRLGALVDEIRRELNALNRVLPAAVDAQWSAAPVARPRSDTAERSKSRHSEPTADIALDADRLSLRKQVVGCAQLLHTVSAALRDARAGVEDALKPWHGEAQ